MHYFTKKKLRKHSGLVIFLYFEDRAFTVVKRDANFQLGYQLSIEGVRKGPPKVVFKRVRGWTSGQKLRV